jgi:hypothetical protein
MPDLHEGKAALLAAAIAHAEGYWIAGAFPRRHSNPGDLIDHTGNKHVFASPAEGFAALVLQVELMLTGRSHVYLWAMSWQRVAQLWTGGDNAATWCASVCDDLDVSPASTLGAYALDQGQADLNQPDPPEHSEQGRKPQ